MAGNDKHEIQVREACLLLIDCLSCFPVDQKAFLVIAGKRELMPADEVTLLIRSLGLEHG